MFHHYFLAVSFCVGGYKQIVMAMGFEKQSKSDLGPSTRSIFITMSKLLKLFELLLNFLSCLICKMMRIITILTLTSCCED